jgi:hypothetical protein
MHAALEALGACGAAQLRHDTWCTPSTSGDMDRSAVVHALCMLFARLCSHASAAACHGTQGVSGARHPCAASGQATVRPLPFCSCSPKWARTVLSKASSGLIAEH